METIEQHAANALPPSFRRAMPSGIKELRNRIQSALDAGLAKTESERTEIAYRNDIEQFLK